MSKWGKNDGGAVDLRSMQVFVTDRILSRCLWLLVMSLIAGSAMGSLILIYSGLFRVIMRQFEAGGVVTAAGVALAAACWALCRHSDDLMDRRA